MTRCWEFLSCDKTQCPACESEELRCWLISGTFCGGCKQGQFLDKIEMCIDCQFFKTNIDKSPLQDTLRLLGRQVGEFKQIINHKDAELERLSSEFSASLSEVCDALKKISSGDPSVRIAETSQSELIRQLKQMINSTAREIGEIVDQSHEFAMGLAEHFDVLQRVSRGDLTAMVTGHSQVELLEALKNITNKMIENISGEINERQQTLSLLNATLESTADGILVVDRFGKIKSTNRKFLRMWHLLESDSLSAIDSNLLQSVLPQLKDPGAFLGKVNQLYESPEKESFDILVFRDGRIFERYSQPQRIGDSIVGRVWSFRDVTEHHRAETAMRESEKKYRNLSDNALVGIFRTNIKGDLLYCNRAFVRIFEFDTREELKESVMPRYKHVRDRNALLAVLKTDFMIENYEVELLTKTGRTVTVLINAVLDGENISGMLMDISDRKKLELQLIQAQKMEAVGTLAGGVAHDFNNILTAIISYGNILLLKMQREDPLRGYIDRILQSSERAATLVQSLLAFSRKQIINPKPVDVNGVITKTENLLGRLIGEDIDLKTNLTTDELIVLADAGQIEQMLMNLATNARDAMPDVGILSISTELVSLDQDFVRVHGYGAPGKYALIAVSDTGLGMDEKTRERIFEPFFTTKEVGKGSGLGLAITYGIIKQHDGYISCYSEPGKGSTFKIYLPLVSETPAKEPQICFVQPEKGHGTILLAEDNTEVRKAANEILTESGYTVIEAVDGEDAINAFMSDGSRDKIDLLLLDVIMPRKNGKEVYEAIRLERPDIKVVFTSGYTADIMLRKGVLEDGLDFVMKPFRPVDLLAKIKKALRGRVS
jgi:PAS domain S-box-containing protein